MAKINFLKKYFWEILVFNLIFFVYVFNLSGQGLSLDEPETILVAKNILTKGYPSPWDGKTFVTVINGNDSTKIGSRYFWSLHPWLQHYLVATSFKLFGESIFSARIPFALFGFSTIVLTYFLALYLFGGRKKAFVTALVLTFSLPFFLYSRQSRHYASEAFFGLLSFILIFTNKKNKLSFSVAVSLIFLFLSNYFSWISLIIAGGMYLWLRNLRKTLFSFIPSVIFASCWIFFLKPAGGNLFLHFRNFSQIFINIFNNLSYINSYLFPFLLLVPFFLTRLRPADSAGLRRISTPKRYRRFPERKLAGVSILQKDLSEKWKNFLFFIGMLLAGRIILYSIFLNPHGRYLYELIPFFAILLVFIVSNFVKKEVFLYLSLFILVSTNIPNLFPKVFFKKTPFFFSPRNFYYELIKEYNQYLPWLSQFLAKNSREEDVFWFSRLGLTFYYYSKIPQLSFICDQEKGELVGPASIDKTKVKYYIFHHSDSQKLSDYRCFDGADEKFLKENYTKLKLDWPLDLYAENDPDIANRLFPPRKIYPDEVTIYQRNR